MSRSRVWLFAGYAAVLAGALASLGMAWQPLLLRILVVGAALLYVPGALMLHLLLPRMNVRLGAFERIPLALAGSLLLMAPFLFIGWSREAYVKTVAAGFLIVVSGLWVWAWRQSCMEWGEKRSFQFSALLPQLRCAWAACSPWVRGLTVLAALTPLYFLFFGHPMNTDDALNINMMRTYAPDGFFSGSFEMYSSALPVSDPAFALWDLCLLTWTHVSGAEAMEVWMLAPVLLAPPIFFATWIFLRRLFKNDVAASWAMGAFLFFTMVLERGWIVKTSGYHMVITAFVLCPLCWRWAFEWAQERKILAGVFSLIAGLALSLVHPAALFVAASVLIFYALGLAMFKRYRHEAFRIFQLLGFWAVALVPYFLFRLKGLSFTFTTSGPQFQHTNPEMFLPWRPFEFASGLFMMNPEVFFAPHYMVEPPFSPRIILLLALLAFPFIIWRAPLDEAKGGHAKVFLISTVVGILVLLCNPLVYPGLGKFLTYQMLRRLVQGIPYFAALGLACAVLNRGSWRRVFQVSAIVGMAAGLWQAAPYGFPEANLELSPWKARWIENPYEPGALVHAEETFGLIQYLQKQPLSVVAGDEAINFAIVAYTRHRMLHFKEAYVSMAVPDQKKREHLIKRIFFDDKVEALNAELDRYQVRYIIFDAMRWNRRGGMQELDKFLESNLWGTAYEDNRYLLIERMENDT